MAHHAIRLSGDALVLPLTLCVGVLNLAGCGGFGPPRTATPGADSVTALNRIAPGPCNQAVASVLAGEGIPVSTLRTATYSELRNGPSSRVSRYDVWLSPQGQSGAIIVSLDETCRPMQIYTQGGASLQRQ